MSKIELSISHKLGIEEAKERITELAAETRRQFGGMVSELEETWSQNTGTVRFRAMGLSVSGHFAVEPDKVRIQIQFPIAAMPFKRRIEEVVMNETSAVLG